MCGQELPAQPPAPPVGTQWHKIPGAYQDPVAALYGIFAMTEESLDGDWQRARLPGDGGLWVVVKMTDEQEEV